MLYPWDHRYYEHQIKNKWKAKLDLNHDFHKYFPLDHVIKTTLEIYEELLSLEFTLLPNVQSWHEDVMCYEVKDLES